VQGHAGRRNRRRTSRAPWYDSAVPELPEVELVRRMLEPALAGVRIDAVEVRRADLRLPFPTGFGDRLTGQQVTAVTRRAKYLLAALSSGETLLVHLGMSGDFRIERGESSDQGKHDHVVFTLASGQTVTFNDPRRFGLMDLVARDGLDAHPALSALGPEPLSAEFDAAALARACRGRRVALKVALLDQRVVAGLGNIYASEALHAARLSPKRKAAILATRSGQPTPAATRLAAAIVAVLTRAIDKPSAPFKVYERAGERCPRRRCGGTINRIVQAGRSTFYCPRCQR
jgi:formamidopyrimidine-DNA glycosylase